MSLSLGEFAVEAAGVECLEFTAIGTAVRAPGAAAPPRPFTSGLSGQDFAKLIMAGWVPVSLVMGVSIGGRPDDPDVRDQRLPRAPNAEIAACTHLVSLTRHDARVRLEQEAAGLGAAGVVARASELRVRSGVCPWRSVREYVAEAMITGTAITRFTRSQQGSRPGSLAMLPLGPRAAARARGEPGSGRPGSRQPPKAVRTAPRPGAERPAQP